VPADGTGRRRVVHVIDNLVVGGAQQLLCTFAEQAPAYAVQTAVVTLHAYPQDDLMRARLRGLGVPVFEVRRRPDSLAGLPGQLATLTGLLRRLRPDVVVSHLSFANTLAPLAATVLRRASVATLHNTARIGDGVSQRSANLEAFALRRARCVVAVGGTVADAYRDVVGGAGILVIRNAVPSVAPPCASDRAHLREELGHGPGLRLIAVARLVQQKAHPDLLEAFRTVREQAPTSCLAVVGDGPLREQLHALSANHGLADSVRWLGRRDDVAALLAAADVFVSASHWEGLPLSLLEALAAGLPVVATNVGDVASVVGDAGRVVDPGVPDALAGALVGLLGDEGRRAQMSKAALAVIEDEFGVDRWIHRLLTEAFGWDVG
jgi:glycosyltransferase involved in cell wall biosynthesis